MKNAKAALARYDVVLAECTRLYLTASTPDEKAAIYGILFEAEEQVHVAFWQDMEEYNSMGTCGAKPTAEEIRACVNEWDVMRGKDK